jgi:hypothetical protein
MFLKQTYSIGEKKRILETLPRGGFDKQAGQGYWCKTVSARLFCP